MVTTTEAPLLAAHDLACHFSVSVPGRLTVRRTLLKAVDGVSLLLPRGRTLGLVGESGCGKSTMARLVLGLVPRTRGEVRLGGEPVAADGGRRWRRQRRRAQLVHQDPLGALDRRLTVGYQIAEPLIVHGIGSPSDRRARASALLDAVGLGPQIAARYPHELSGGQRQRVVLARALVLEPELLVCDEPVSALDVSIQAQVVNLLQDLRDRLGHACLFISHDLKAVRQISDEIAVMYLGRIVEQGPAEDLLHAPAHPYTQALVSAVPGRGGRQRGQRILLTGDPPSPVAVPPGCAFHPRCRFAQARCRADRPDLRPQDHGRLVACHFAEEIAARAAAA